MIWKFIHFNRELWELIPMAENTLLIQLKSWELDPLPHIWKLNRAIQEANWPWLVDLVPAYASVGLLFDRTRIRFSELAAELEMLEKMELEDLSVSPVIHTVPVCYERGLDWEEVEQQSGVEKEKYIRLHVAGEYRLAMIGFLPGFIYLAGLDGKLACRRRAMPRRAVPAGAVGIGGTQTGIYSLSSPGGWQIIGQAVPGLFNEGQTPPISLRPGDQVSFAAVSEDEFLKLSEEYEKGKH